jgi:hypothetical protein
MYDPDDATRAFDETAFIRHAVRRSVGRTFAVSTLVAVLTVVLLGLGSIGWTKAIEWQAQRIAAYYEEVIRVTQPNSEVSGGRPRGEFPGATMILSVYRRVGGAVIPAGEITARFYPWGGESFSGPEHLEDTSDGRLLIVPDATADLMFLEPPVGGGDVSQVRKAERGDTTFMGLFARARTSSMARLAAAPPSATVEVAVSFDDVMSLEALQERLGPDLRLVWGAVRVGDAAGSVDGSGAVHAAGTTWWPHVLENDVFGISFGHGDVDTGAGSADRQASSLRELESLATDVPGSLGRRLRKQDSYVKSNGVHYYGAVVIGPPAAALNLAGSPDVSTITLGTVSMPWQ